MSIKIICDLCGNEIQSGYEVYFKVLQQESIYGKGDLPWQTKLFMYVNRVVVN